MKTPVNVNLIQGSIITFVWDSLDKIASFDLSLTRYC